MLNNHLLSFVQVKLVLDRDGTGTFLNLKWTLLITYVIGFFIIIFFFVSYPCPNNMTTLQFDVNLQKKLKIMNMFDMSKYL